MNTIIELHKKLSEIKALILLSIQESSSLHDHKLNEALNEAKRNIQRAQNQLDDKINTASHS